MITRISIIAAFLAVSSNAATISTWNLAADSAGGSVNSGMDTDSPTFGNGNPSNIDNAIFTGEFGETITLAVGETLTVSWDITLTGGLNNGEQLRFLVGDYGTTANLDWNGGWNFIEGQDLFTARTDGIMISNSADAVDLNATKVQSGSYDGDSVAPYTFTFSVTRDSTTTVDLVGSLVGGDGNLSRTYTELDRTTSLFDYNGVGILFGNGLDQDQAVISGAQYSVIPEPSALLLGAMGGLLLLRRRR